MLADLDHVEEALVEEVDLDIERPAFHVVVEISQIGVEVHGFVFGGPVEVVDQHPGEGGLAAADVACYRDMHTALKFLFLRNR